MNKKETRQVSDYLYSALLTNILAAINETRIAHGFEEISAEDFDASDEYQDIEQAADRFAQAYAGRFMDPAGA